MRAVLAAVVLLVSALGHPGGARADGADDVTRNFLLPTGELMPPGELQWSQQQLFMAFTVDVGITEGLELDLIVPPPPIGGQAQLRVGLLPRSSRMRLNLGAGVALSTFTDEHLFTTVSATGAYLPSDRLNVHGTIIAYGRPSDGGRLGVLSAGFRWRLHRRAALMLDGTRFSMPNQDCIDTAKVVACRRTVKSTTALSVGLKLLARRVQVDVGVFLSEEFDYIPLPLVSFVH